MARPQRVGAAEAPPRVPTAGVNHEIGRHEYCASSAETSGAARAGHVNNPTAAWVRLALGAGGRLGLPETHI